MTEAVVFEELPRTAVCLGQLRDAHQILADWDTLCVKKVGIPGVVGALLLNLSEVDQPKISEFARTCGISPQSMTADIDKLEQRGLIVRMRDPLDRRVQHIALTDDGRALATKIREQVEGALV